MQRCRHCTAIALVAGCGRIDFSARFDAESAGAGDSGGEAYAELVLKSGPRAYYRLDETGGAVAVDASGHGLDGLYFATNGGSIAYGRPGARGSDSSTGVRFDGEGNAGNSSDARMEFPADLLDWSSDFTLEMFALPHAPAPDPYPSLLGLCEVYTANGFRFAIGDADQLSTWANESGGASRIDAPSTVPYGAFLHLVLVHEASTFSIYRDGALSVSGTMVYVPADSSSVCGIGAFQGMPSATTFDELAIYDRALSASEIAVHAAAR